jgi:hypothetical protein
MMLFLNRREKGAQQTSFAAPKIVCSTRLLGGAALTLVRFFIK